jgi:predicted TIM-barrel fold metal-dependent hydrolase
MGIPVSNSTDDSLTKGALKSEGMAPVPGAASQPSTEVCFEVPAGACDCLTHIYGDESRFPMAPERTYTPELASIGEINALHRALHIDRVVIVQPTIYGTENTCTIDAVKQLGQRARGIAVIREDTPSRVLEEMSEAGVCGIRINLETVGLTDPRVARHKFEVAVEQVGHRPGWHIQIYTRPSIIAAIADLLRSCPVPIALDHFAGVQANGGMKEKGFEVVLELLEVGKAYVKLSAPYLASQFSPDFADVTPLARAFIEANRERVLWATNWPHPNAGRGENRKHTEVIPLRRVDDGLILNMLLKWAPNAGDRKQILVDNPARLYGF